jgi:VCBS repeat-containing protein
MADSALTNQHAAIVIPVLANDTDNDGDALRLAGVDTTGTSGDVHANDDGTVTYDPEGKFDDMGLGQSRTDRFSYAVDDGFGGRTTGAVTVTVTTAPIAAISLPVRTRSRTVAVDWTGTAAGYGAITGWYLSAEPALPAAPAWTPSPPSSYELGAGEGARWLYAWVQDADGYTSRRASASTILDETAPAGGGAPRASLAVGSRVTTKVPLAVSWPAAIDALSGPVAYHFAYSGDGGATWSIPKPTSATSTSLALDPASYLFRVEAQDLAGNTTIFTSSAIAVGLSQERAGAVTYSGSFTRARLSGASGGYVKHSAIKGRSATFRATGRTFAWVSTRARARGIAKVYVDGRRVATIDLYASSTKPGRIVWTRTFATSGAHAIRIVVTGSKRAAATSRRIDIDAFVVLR